MPKHDTIDVALKTSIADVWDETVEYMVLILNGEEVKGNFNVMEFVCSDAVVDHAKLELMTCSCGSAGCAGIWDGTEVKRGQFITEWNDIDSGLPQKNYSFTNKWYDAAIDKAKVLMLEVAKRREVTGRSDGDYDGLMSFWSVKEFESIMKSIEAYIVKESY